MDTDTGVSTVHSIQKYTVATGKTIDPKNIRFVSRISDVELVWLKHMIRLHLQLFFFVKSERYSTIILLKVEMPSKE